MKHRAKRGLVATILLAATVVGRIAPLAELRISLSPMTGFLPIAAALALPVAALIVTARTPRRVVPAVLAASLVCFLVFYPFLSALPVDSDLPYVAQALLPTWETGFRFAPGSGALPAGLLVLGVPILVVGAIAWWVIGRVDARRARREGAESSSRTPSAGSAPSTGSAAGP